MTFVELLGIVVAIWAAERLIRPLNRVLDHFGTLVFVVLTVCLLLVLADRFGWFHAIARAL